MKPSPLAKSLAVAGGIFWILCSLLIWVLPNFSLYWVKTGLMGLQEIILSGFNLDFPTFLAGLVLTTVTCWVFGYLWGSLYQRFVKEEK